MSVTEEEFQSDMGALFGSDKSELEEELNDGDSIIPRIPVMIKGNDNIIMDNPTSFNLQRREDKEAPGFFSTLGHAFVRENELAAAGTWISEKLHEQNPLQDSSYKVDPDELASQLEKNGISDQRYWGYISNATTKTDFQNRIEYSQKQIKNDEYFNKGSGIADFIGGVGGYAFSPSSLIPIAGAVKYAKVGKNIVQNMMRFAPGVTAQSAAHNAFIQSLAQKGNMHDFLINTAIDSVAGTALMGLGRGLTNIHTGARVYNARSVIRAAEDNVTVLQAINDKGEFTGLLASPVEGKSASAAVVERWQGFLDSRPDGLLAYPKAAKLLSIANPLVRNLTSSFSTMNSLVNKFADHSFSLAGFERNIPRDTNVEELVNLAKAESTQLNSIIKGLYNESLGIEGKTQLTAAAARTFKSAMNKDGFVTFLEFQKSVGDAIVTQQPHASQQVNHAAELVDKHNKKHFGEYLKAHGMDEEILDPRTAMGYMMRMYDKDMLTTRIDGKEGFNTVVGGILKTQDAQIVKHSEPLKVASKVLEDLKILKGKDFADDKALALKIEMARDNLSLEKQKLNDAIRDNPDLKMLLDGRSYLSSSQESELRTLLKPRNEARAKMDEEGRDLAKLKKDNSALKQKLHKSRTKSKSDKLRADIDKLESEIESSEQVHEELKTDYEAIKGNLEDQARVGNINENFYRLNQDNEFSFRDPDHIPKFRETIAEGQHANAANSYRLKLLDYTPEQITQSILSNFSGGAETNPMRERSLMIPDMPLRDAGFLSHELDKSINLYTNSLARRTAVQTALKDPIYGNGFEAFARSLADERQQKELNILKEFEDDAKGKEQALLKLSKDFEKARSDLSDFQNIAFGDSNKNTKGRKFFNNVRSYTMATRLGAVNISSISDYGAIILKNGLWPTIRDGLLPSIRTLNGKLNTVEGREMRENAAHMSLGLEHILGGHTDRAYSPGMSDSVAVSGKVGSVLSKMNDVAMNVFGQTYLDNFNQTLVANITQSKVMRYLQKHVDGTLTKTQKNALLRMGINPNEWSERMLSQFKKFGGEKRGNAYQSRYFDWQDYEAQQVMGKAIRRTVSESVLKAGWLDSPLWANDGMMSMVFLFHKWGFSAMNRWVLPTMQKPEAEHAIGIAAMLGLGALVDPLRKWTRGEEADVKFDSQAFINAFSNSSLGGWQMDALETLNQMTGQHLFTSNDRKQQLTIGGIIGGAAGGIGDDMARIANSAMAGKFSQQDAKRLLGLVPLANVWWLRGWTNSLIKNSSLPEKSRDATSIWGS